MTSCLIVIPCLNEEAFLPGLLQQLRADGPDHLIVVADGGSTDASRAIVESLARRDPNVRLLDNPHRIQSAGVNLALRSFGAGRRWFVRVDAHCKYPDGYVSGLLETAESMSVVSVVVPMVTASTTCFQSAVATAQNSVLGTGGSAHRHLGRGRFVDHGHHALMSVEAFATAGGYNEAMSHNEDAELDQRLQKLGKIWLEPRHAITYFPRRTPIALARQYFGYGKGRAQTLKMHRMRPRVRQMVPVMVPMAVALALLAPLSPVFALPILGWASIALGAGLALGLAQRSRCAIMSGPAAMLMHLAWGCGFLKGTVSQLPTARLSPVSASTHPRI